MFKESPGLRWASLFALLVLVLSGSSPAFAQTFKNPRLIPTGSSPSTIVTADFNHDSKPDIAYIDGSGLHTLIGNGDGSFQHGQDFPLPQGFGGAITVADVNKDGNLDMIVGSRGAMGQIGVFLGQGNGSFGAMIVTQFTPFGDLNSVVLSTLGVADVNEDGAVDLIASDGLNNAMYILLGNNTGSFTLSSSFFQSSAPTNVYTADFNGDHHIDFIVQGLSSADVTVFLGNGDGTFKPGVRYSGPTHIQSLVLADMNDDGHPDIVEVGQDNSISILLGNPDGTFENTSSGGTANAGVFPKLFAVADLNADSKPDLLSISENGLCVLLGESNLAFGPPRTFVTATNYPVAVLADFNGDGRADVATTNSDGISILFGNGDGTFQSADSYDTGQSIQSVVVANFNQDTLPDIAAAALSGPPQILLGTGGGKFALSQTVSSPSGTVPPNVLTGDFDGDGKPDLLFSGTGDNVVVLYGNGDGTFSAPATSSFTVVGFGSTAAGDFNHDGRTDIVTGDYSSYHIILGQANRTLPSSNIILPGGLDATSPPAVGDFNGDGKLDFAFPLLGVQVFLGNGDGTFTMGRLANTLITGLTQGYGGPLAVGDFDGDGKLDIAVCEPFDPGFVILYGNGDGTFQDPVFYQLTTTFGQMVVADLDNDGKPDLVFSNGSIISTVHNTGSRTFGPEAHFLAGNIGQFVVQDVNGDGFPDIIVANSTGTTVTVLLSEASVGETTGGVTISPEPSAYNSPFNLKLTISAVNSSSGNPTGTVRFSVDGVPVPNSVPLVSGVATFLYANSPSVVHGVHTISAEYSGDSTFLPVIFTANHTVVSEVFQPNIQLTAQPTSAPTSQTIHFVATVTSAGPTPIPFAMVAFHDGNTDLGASQIDSNGVAVFDTALLRAGTHSITAIFLGCVSFDGNVTYATGVSTVVTIVINSNATNTAIASLQNPVTVGATASLTATVSSSFGTPTGAVTFFDGSSPIATEPLSATGIAICSCSFSATGTHVITATYLANGTFASSNSEPLNLGVNSLASNPTNTSLAIAQSSQGGAPLTLSAHVTARTGTPNGAVIFLLDGASIGQINLDSNGSAAFAGASIAPGSHYFTAEYPGNASYGPSISQAQMEDSSKSEADFLLNFSSASAAVMDGQSTSVLLTVSPVNGFNQNISLSCSTGSAAISCNFLPALIRGGGTSNLTLAVAKFQASSARVPARNYGRFGSGTILIFIALIVFRFVFPKRQHRLLWASICLVCFICVFGCGDMQLTERVRVQGSYTISITAVSGQQSSTISHSAQFQLTVNPGD
jgi:hypothetical protein